MCGRHGTNRNSSSWLVRSISGASIVVIVSVLRTIASLVVRRGGKVVFVTPVDTRTTLQSLLHLWLRAGATREVSIATNRRKCGSASSEIVVGQGGKVAVIRPSTIAPVQAHVIVTCRVERRCIGGHPTVRGKATFMFCGLPVDGLETILELRRGTELPLADDGPNNSAATNG